MPLFFFRQIWRELFSPLHALNFGIAGDTTCNVLWRLQNGELENIRPKVSKLVKPGKGPSSVLSHLKDSFIIEIVVF